MVYARQLLEVARAKKVIDNLQLDAFKTEVMAIDKKIDAVAAEITELQNVLAATGSAVAQDALNKGIEEKKTTLAELREAVPTLCQAHDYLEKVKSLATAWNQLQEAQIRANLFANEAYINYSALYHTVHWQQSGDTDLRIDRRQVVMGSLLQQIGFRLLHAKAFRQVGLSEGAILYRVAKYEQRMADMFYGDSTHWFGDRLFKPSPEEDVILRRLKSQVKADRFNDHLFPLLNRGTRLIRAVKKNIEIAPADKARKAYLLAFRDYLHRIRNIRDADTMQEEDIEALLSVHEIRFKTWLAELDNNVLLDTAQKIILETVSAKLAAAEPTSANTNSVNIWGHEFHMPRMQA